MYERIGAPPPSDTIDVADVMATLRRQWRAVIGFVLLGVAGAGAVVLFAPRRFDGKASVLARPSGQSGGSISSRMTDIGQLLGGLGPLGNAGTLETELQLLRSEALAGKLVDSLALQFRVRDPAGTPPMALVAHSAFPGSFAPRTYQFERTPQGTYRTERSGKTYELTPGRPASLDVGTLTLRADSLPERFKLKVLDREDAVRRTTRSLTATKAGGDVAKIVYRGEDSVTAAAAANALVRFYLDRRKTTDRGTNARRVEFVSVQLDSTRAELSATERALRKYQESTRLLNAETAGEVELQSASTLRRSLTELQVDEGAIRQLLSRAQGGRITSRDLAAHPAFIRNSAVSPLVNQLTELEARRIMLLERRTEKDPEVHALDQTMRLLETNIAAMARSYAAAITEQREQMQARLAAIENELLALPAAAERVGRLQRDVIRLTQISTALEAQLVEARLAAIGEGGDIQQIDMAVPQRKPAFPQPLLTMGIGTAGGLVAGMIAALMLGWFGRWLRDPSRSSGPSASARSASSRTRRCCSRAPSGLGACWSSRWTAARCSKPERSRSAWPGRRNSARSRRRWSISAATPATASSSWRPRARRAPTSWGRWSRRTA